MNTTPHPKNEKYAGAPPAVVSLGHGATVGWVGSLVGAGIGAVASNFFNVNFFKSATAKVAEVLKKVNIRLDDRMGVILSGLVSGWIVGHYVGMAIGVKRGTEVKDDGQKQFDRIIGQRDKAEAKLAQLEDEIGQLANHSANPETGTHAANHSSRGESHANKVAAEKAEATEIVR